MTFGFVKTVTFFYEPPCLYNSKVFNTLLVSFFSCWVCSFGVWSFADLVSWPSPTCKFPDWLDGVTWRDLSGQYRLTADGEVLTSSMTSTSRGRRRSQSVMAEYRCLAVWSLTDTSSSSSSLSSSSASASAAEHIVILSLAHHNWLVFFSFIFNLFMCCENNVRFDDSSMVQTGA